MDNLITKIIRAHAAEGTQIKAGADVAVKVDQTLTHDINAVMTYLAFEQIGLDRCGTERSVSYLDHNLLYMDQRTPDDHIYLKGAAKRYGAVTSLAGNGVCHVVHTARFGIPGKILMGGDSHTPHGGSIGMLCIGVGGMDVAAAMTGLPMHIRMPEVINVELRGQLRAGCNAKDIVLELLRRTGIKGGVGKAFEYTGPALEHLSVPQRATIANMGAEMGLTTSIFPADEQVRRFFVSQGRETEFVPMRPDPGCGYDGRITVELGELEPLCACPHQPDNVVPLSAVPKKPVDQVFIGSCTNTSYSDVAKAAAVLRGRKVHEDVSCTCAISSRQIYKKLMEDGYIAMLTDAGVRMLECACGPCCAIGQVPPTNGVAVRTSNRNFKGRSGNPNAEIYLVSPESAAATAIAGTFASAEDILGGDIGLLAEISEPELFDVNDNMLVPPLPPESAPQTVPVKGPNIRELPVPDAPENRLTAKVSLKAGDNITTDDITPAGADFSSMRSNIPAMSAFCYHRYDPEFAVRAGKLAKSIIVAGENYGQGSSREHAAIVPMYLGVKAVIAKSFARIHRSNLINHGIVPLVFADMVDYEKIRLYDELTLPDLRKHLSEDGEAELILPDGSKTRLLISLSEAEREVILDGGQLRHIRRRLAEAEG